MCGKRPTRPAKKANETLCCHFRCGAAGGAYPKTLLMPGGTELDSDAYDRLFQSQIRKAVEQEKREENRK